MGKPDKLTNRVIAKSFEATYQCSTHGLPLIAAMAQSKGTQWWRWDGKLMRCVPPSALLATMNDFLDTPEYYDHNYKPAEIVALLTGYGSLGVDERERPPYIRSRCVNGYDRFESTPDLRVFKNGVAVNFKTGEVLPASPAIYTDNIMHYDWDDKADCPLFMQVLNTFLPDPKDREALQLAAGNMMLHGNTRQILTIFRGPSGTYKSSMLDIFKQLSGRGNYAECDFDKVNNDKNLCNYATKLMTYDEDMTAVRPGMKGFDELIGMHKSLTGGRDVGMRALYQDQKTVDVTAAPFYCTNKQINIGAKDDAFINRLVFIPFEVSITEHGAAKDPTKHITEHELPGVARWALEGALKIKDVEGPRGLPMSDRGKAWLSRCYYVDSPFSSFLQDCEVCECENSSYSCTGLYSLYRMWMDKVYDPENHEDRLAKKQFDGALCSEFDMITPGKTRKSEDKPNKPIKSWLGLKVKNPEGAEKEPSQSQTQYLLS